MKNRKFQIITMTLAVLGVLPTAAQCGLGTSIITTKSPLDDLYFLGFDVGSAMSCDYTTSDMEYVQPQSQTFILRPLVSQLKEKDCTWGQCRAVAQYQPQQSIITHYGPWYKCTDGISVECNETSGCQSVGPGTQTYTQQENERNKNGQHVVEYRSVGIHRPSNLHHIEKKVVPEKRTIGKRVSLPKKKPAKEKRTAAQVQTTTKKTTPAVAPPAKQPTKRK